jgi:hypothetical protein
VVKSFFNTLKVNASPTFSAKPTKYPGLSVVSENLRQDPNTGQVQTNKTSRCEKYLVFPP